MPQILYRPTNNDDVNPGHIYDQVSSLYNNKIIYMIEHTKAKNDNTRLMLI